MTGKAEPDRIPSPSTVAYMKIKRLCLVKKQLQEELPEKILCKPAKHQMIWGYSVRMEKVFFFNALWHDYNIRTEHTRCTIKDHHHQSAGNEILCQIQNTISDRAGTELRFNVSKLQRRVVATETSILQHHGWWRERNSQ